MIKKILLLALLALFITACATKPKDTADTSGTGSSSSDSSVSASDSEEGTLTETQGTGSGTAIEPGSQEDFIVNVGDRVYFDYDSAELDADAQELLQHQAAWFKEHNILVVTIEGHCDERGTREYNLALGERRANAAKDYMMTYGISGNRISVISYGKERPVNSGSTPLAWSQNRRSVTVKAN